MSTRRFAFFLGLFFVLAGIAGFLPFLSHPEAGASLADNAIACRRHGGAILGTGDDMLFGLFPVNAAHNVVHLLFGLWGLAAARSWRGALVYARSVAIIFFLLAIAGLLPARPDRLRPAPALCEGRVAARTDRAGRPLFRLGRPRRRPGLTESHPRRAFQAGPQLTVNRRKSG